MQFVRHTLPNGLEIVAECNGDAHSTALGYFVNTGARDETDEVAGVSHFLEHMMFKGTPSRTAEDVNREFDEMGAHYNAFTSEENTVYYAAVLPEYQDRATALLGDILRPSLRTEDFDTEKQVILEEIQMYQDHPLARSVLGTLDSVGQLPVEAMRDYFNQRYSPGNITVVAAGRVDFDELVTSVNRYCGHWAPVETARKLERPRALPAFECITRSNSAQQYVLQLADGPAATDDDRFAAKLLATVLGDDSGSRLYWSLIDSGLAEQASLGHHDYQGAGLFITYLSSTPDQAAGNLQRVQGIYRQVESDGISSAELEQAKNKINSRVVLSSERPRGRLFNVGGNWTQRREYRSVKDDLRAVEAVTVEQTMRVLGKYPLTVNTTVCVGPLADVPRPL
jgi:predicted Zn-dependent peptidase